MNNLAFKKLNVGDKVKVNTNCDSPQGWEYLVINQKGLVLYINKADQIILYFDIDKCIPIFCEAKFLDVVKEFNRVKKRRPDKPF